MSVAVANSAVIDALHDKLDVHRPSQAKSFTTPDHPSLQFLQKLESKRVPGSNEDVAGSIDPHQPPSFSTESIIRPSVPVIYLPPLISKLPREIPQVPLPQDHPPMTTETHLPDIDPASLSLHKALHHFKPTSDKYASLSYVEAFNWSDLELPADEEREWYCVAFRSKRKDGSDGSPLYEADRQAHEEAVQNGGLLMYWYGVPDPESGLNLATCIWQSRKHAIAATSRPRHTQAMKLARDSYEIYGLERYVLRKKSGIQALKIEEFAGGDVGW